MTMGNNFSLFGQSARATAPVEPIATPPATSSPVAVHVAGPADAAAAIMREREAGSGHAGDIAPPSVVSTPGRKRRAEDDDNSDRVDAKRAKTDTPVAVHVAGSAAAAAANERVREAGPSCAGGGASSSIPSTPGVKRRAEDDDDANPAEAKRARTEEAAATVNGEVCRGLKRAAESVADSTALDGYKRRRIDPESADEEIIRADLPTSARDVVLASQGSALGRFVPVTANHKPTGGVTFLSLPPEIREMVYRHLLVAAHPVVPRVQHRPPNFAVGFPIRKVVSLLLSHRTVYKEALGFMLMNNTFKLTIKHHRGWLNLLGRHSSACIRSLFVECDGKNKHAADNLVAFQNTMRKRTSPSQFREVTYRFSWSMDPDSAVRMLSLSDARTSWKYMKSLKLINIQISSPWASRDTMLAQERVRRVFSRVCLESGKPVRGIILKSLRRNRDPEAFMDVKLKEGWKKYVTIDKRGGGRMVVRDADWDEVVEVTLIPETDQSVPSAV